MSAVTVIDYGASNLLNVVRALKYCGAQVDVTNHAATIAKAERLILPGVGAFGDCSAALEKLGLAQPIKEYVTSGKPFLGICVGMQVMFDVGEEFGTHKGLGIIAGKVVRIPDTGRDGKPHKIPHIGWDTLLRPADLASWNDSVLASMDNASVYFVHSYMGVPADASHRLATVDYNGVEICAAVRRGNAYGCQFHPEKSGEAGLSLLKAFMML
ncbi:MAG: imidazole glycerol phosphate synthase subunit HisH [Alphaproteobacteria bacterium]